jgi:hypothetical protein
MGNVENSTGIAIGHGAHALVNQTQAAGGSEIGDLLADFIRSLPRYREFIDDEKTVQEVAIDARTEAMRPSPKWSAVRRMLTAISASVASVAALTDAINNIQALVERAIG